MKKDANQAAIPIFLCTDNNYVVPTYFAIYSLLDNYHGDSDIDLYILTSDDVTEDSHILLLSLHEKYSFCKMYVVNMKNSFESVRINSSHVSKATLYRLLIPRIVKTINNHKSINEPRIEKCIYLDSDIIVEGDITELYNIDINGFCFGGVRDHYCANDSRTTLREMLNIPTLKDYINAGVLLINIKEIDECGFSQQLETYGYRNEFQYNDQDVINSVCYGKIKVIPLKYNAMTTCLYYNDKEFYEQYGDLNIEEARRKPVIIHFILRKKPWSYRLSVKASRWWMYVKKQDQHVKQAYIYPFLKAHRSSASEIAREATKNTMIYLRIFNPIRRTYSFLKSTIDRYPKIFNSK